MYCMHFSAEWGFVQHAIHCDEPCFKFVTVVRSRVCHISGCRMHCSVSLSDGCTVVWVCQTSGCPQHASIWVSTVSSVSSVSTVCTVCSPIASGAKPPLVTRLMIRICHPRSSWSMLMLMVDMCLNFLIYLPWNTNCSRFMLPAPV